MTAFVPGILPSILILSCSGYDLAPGVGVLPVTCAEYDAHVDRYSDRPFAILVTHPHTGVTTVRGRSDSPQKLLGRGGEDFKKRLIAYWDRSDPLAFGLFHLIELRKGLCGVGAKDPHRPLGEVSWFHALEYCVGEGLFLPAAA